MKKKILLCAMVLLKGSSAYSSYDNALAELPQQTEIFSTPSLFEAEQEVMDHFAKAIDFQQDLQQKIGSLSHAGLPISNIIISNIIESGLDGELIFNPQLNLLLIQCLIAPLNNFNKKSMLAFENIAKKHGVTFLGEEENSLSQDPEVQNFSNKIFGKMVNSQTFFTIDEEVYSPEIISKVKQLVQPFLEKITIMAEESFKPSLKLQENLMKSYSAYLSLQGKTTPFSQGEWLAKYVEAKSGMSFSAFFKELNKILSNETEIQRLINRDTAASISREIDRFKFSYKKLMEKFDRNR